MLLGCWLFLAFICGGGTGERFGVKVGLPFLDFDSMVGGNFSRICVRPLGQRMVARKVPSALPRPKKISLLCWDKNPEPACSSFVCGWPGGDAAAPSRHGCFFPCKRKATELPRSFIALRNTRICGAVRFFRMTSSVRRDRGPRARTRGLSSRKSRPTMPETSDNVPSSIVQITHSFETAPGGVRAD